ncbi:MAG: NAD-dependent epimerase/dehydratase family protein [Mariniphaga sp.]|nr:NAD-dependent epimerase/dehydratase family protein [Mariniphaga sp.]
MKTALIAGASGLIGKELVQKLISSDQYRRIYVLSRKKSGLVHEKITELVIDFDQIDQLKFDEPIDDLFCTLGTTIKQAGSRDNFMKVDYQYIIEFAKLGKRIGATKFLVISAMGANSKSSVFYNQVKGMTEEALKSIGFSRLVILRPSLLLGERPEPRFGEQIASFFMKALNFLIPDNFKAIKAEKVADNMLRMATDSAEGISIVESGEMIRN